MKKLLFLLLSLELYTNIYSLSPNAVIRENGVEKDISLSEYVNFSIDSSIDYVYNSTSSLTKVDSSKINIESIAYSLNDLKYMNQNSFSDGLLALFQTDEDLTFLDVVNVYSTELTFNYLGNPRDYKISDSYKKITYDNFVIGESYWSVSAPNSYFICPKLCYNINFVIPNYFVKIEIEYSNSNDFSIVNNYQKYFSGNANEYRWQSEEMINQFYKDVLSTKETLSSKIGELKSIVNQISESLLINENLLNKERMKINNIGFQGENYSFDLPHSFYANSYITKDYEISVSKFEYGFSILYEKMTSEMSEKLRKLLIENHQIKQIDLEKILLENKPFILSNYNNYIDVISSFEHMRLNVLNIGEGYFSLSKRALEFDSNFFYTIRFLDNEKLNEIHITLNIKNFEEMYKSVMMFIEKKGDLWFWKSRESVAEFYQKLQNYDPSLPESLIEFQKTVDCIKSTLEIDGKLVSFTPTEITIQTEAVVNDDNVRLRSVPFLGEESHVISLLMKNQKVEILSEGFYQKIDGFEAPWYKIQTSDNKTGWVYGGYLSK